jgi:hypothetical protein
MDEPLVNVESLPRLDLSVSFIRLDESASCSWHISTVKSDPPTNPVAHLQPAERKPDALAGFPRCLARPRRPDERVGFRNHPISSVQLPAVRTIAFGHPPRGVELLLWRQSSCEIGACGTSAVA